MSMRSIPFLDRFPVICGEWEGVAFTQLLDLIIQDGLDAYRERQRQVSSYDTNVLQQAQLNGMKK